MTITGTTKRLRSGWCASITISERGSHDAEEYIEAGWHHETEAQAINRAERIAAVLYGEGVAW